MKIRLLGEKISDVVKSIGQNPMGITTGLKALDETIRGLRPANLILIAARPSQGKTSLMLDIALNADNTMVFSIEMSYEQLRERALCNIAGLNHHRITSGKFEKEDKEKLNFSASELKAKKIIVDDYTSIIYPRDYQRIYNKNIPIDSINNKIEKAIQFGCNLIIIDYLQLMRFGMWAEREDLRIHKITWELAQLSKEHNIPIVLLSQLRRFEPERYKGKPDPRPRLDDLRDSGAIEQDANTVILIHRPSVYKVTKEVDLFSDNIEEDVELIIAKNRNGPIGTVNVAFHSYMMSFRDSINEEI